MMSYGIALFLAATATCVAFQTSANFPPRFVSTDGTSGTGEIVVRVKEGPSDLGKEIVRLAGEDPDGDPLTFGVLGTIGSDIIRVENVPVNGAIVYLRKELDRETRDSYTVVLTLTDNKLGKGNYVSSANSIALPNIAKVTNCHFVVSRSQSPC